MRITEQDYRVTNGEIAVRALAIWKRSWISQEFQIQYLVQAKEELEAERGWDCDDQTAEA